MVSWGYDRKFLFIFLFFCISLCCRNAELFPALRGAQSVEHSESLVYQRWAREQNLSTKKSTQNEHKAAKPWRNRRSFQMSKHAHKARCHSGGSTLTGFHGVLPNGELRVWTIALYSTSAVNDRHTYECQMIKISACFGCFRMMKYWAKTTWMLAKTLSILIKDLCFWMPTLQILLV